MAGTGDWSANTRIIVTSDATLVPANEMEFTPRSFTIQSGAALTVTHPMTVGGTFSKPTYAPDLGVALSEAAKARVEEKVEEQQQKLQEKLGGELQDKLKGLFK